MSIFVSVASYCDPVLGFTLARALSTARWPDQLHFGVVDQSPVASPQPAPADVAPARLSYLRIDPLYARGPCWARALAMSLYDGEQWFFQIDSHTDFELHWDATLIAQAQAVLPGRRGVVLSSYPNSFVFEDNRPAHRPVVFEDEGVRVGGQHDAPSAGQHGLGLGDQCRVPVQLEVGVRVDLEEPLFAVVQGHGQGTGPARTACIERVDA